VVAPAVQPDARITLEVYGDPAPAFRRLAEMLLAAADDSEPEAPARRLTPRRWRMGKASEQRQPEILVEVDATAEPVNESNPPSRAAWFARRHSRGRRRAGQHRKRGAACTLTALADNRCRLLLSMLERGCRSWAELESAGLDRAAVLENNREADAGRRRLVPRWAANHFPRGQGEQRMT